MSHPQIFDIFKESVYDILIIYHHMSTLSVPLPHALEAFIETMVKRGFASTKAEVVRQALSRYAEEEAVASVLRARQEGRDGKEIRGDLHAILKRM